METPISLPVEAISMTGSVATGALISKDRCIKSWYEILQLKFHGWDESWRWLKFSSVRVSEKSPRKKKKTDFPTQYLAVRVLKPPLWVFVFCDEGSIIKYKSKVLEGREITSK